MILAFVLVDVETGFDAEVLDRLRAFPNITEAYSVYSVYDIICRVEAENMAALKAFVLEKIRKSGLIRSTVTLIVII
ncbi:MAG: Lrp/AsnC family transcriptional regulator [Candidatus Odinarchaeota archaeon]